MIKVENVEVYGWEAAIRGARNPMNSWDKSDSTCDDCRRDCPTRDCVDCDVYVGLNDHKLLCGLANAGPDHGKFLRMITVSLDITAPLYWWKEFDTYKVGTVANSCSTMHKIHAKQFTFDDFSHDHLDLGLGVLGTVIDYLNVYRDEFLSTKDKKYWWQMIQLLPSSYNQRRTVMLNYQVLKTMFHARKNHKLDEWREFCDWIRTLPYFELITGELTYV
jgi:hypothetical protein